MTTFLGMPFKQAGGFGDDSKYGLRLHFSWTWLILGVGVSFERKTRPSLVLGRAVQLC